MKGMLGRFSKTSLNFFQYVKDNRKELVEKNNKKIWINQIKHKS